MASKVNLDNPNSAYITAVLATKHAGGTSMKASMTSQPSEAPLLVIPPGSPDRIPAFLYKPEKKPRFVTAGAGFR
jgi:hypothetical protein